MEIANFWRKIASFYQLSEWNGNRQYVLELFFILAILTAFFYHFLFLRYLNSIMARFLSNILLPFPNSNDLNCCSTGTNQNFIIGCWYFLKKRKLSVRTKTLLFLAGFFLVVFVSLWHCSHVFFLPIKWWWFNIFLFFVLWDLGVAVVS